MIVIAILCDKLLFLVFIFEEEYIYVALIFSSLYNFFWA